MKKIDTHKQNADYLTKGLPHEVFHENRKRVQGWIVFVSGKPNFYVDWRADQTDQSHERESRENYASAPSGPSSAEDPKDPKSFGHVLN